MDPQLTRAAQYVRMSTEHQQYSIDNQVDAIREFAESHGYRIVRTYADHGLSGLTLRERPALQRLLSDVETQTTFSALLIYDISRMGRFQELDEAAAYEFHLRSHGVDVVYCIEQFDNSGGPINALLKHMKRSMAAEYSRDLSLKVARGKRRSALAGNWVHGPAPYGYRRCAVSSEGRRMVLERGELRHAQQWTTTLAVGPPEEVAMVRRMFALYTRGGRSLGMIAKTINAEGWRRRNGDLWDAYSVRKVVTNPTYCGDLVYGRTKSFLKSGPAKPTPEDEWLWARGAVPAIVSRESVKKAQARIRRGRKPSSYSDEELLGMLTELLAKHGSLSHRIIDNDKSIPSSTFFGSRFGSVSIAIGLAGYKPSGRRERVERSRRIRQLRVTLTGQLRLILEAGGRPTIPSRPHTFLLEGLSVTTLVLTPVMEKGCLLWKAQIPKNWVDIIVLAMVASDQDEVPTEYRAIDRSWVRFGSVYFGAKLKRFSPRFDTLEAAATRALEIGEMIRSRF